MEYRIELALPYLPFPSRGSNNHKFEFVVLCVRFDLQRKVTGFTALLKEVAEAAGGDPIIERT